MNKHGQTLVLFVILIPIFIALLAFVIDMGMIFSSKTHVSEVTKTIIRENIDDYNQEEIDSKIKDLMIKNKIQVENLKVNVSDQKIQIQNDYEIDSLFGAIIGIKKYEIKIDIVGIKKDNRVLFE